MQELKTFQELTYERPDIGAVREQLRRLIEGIRGAGSYEQLRALWMEREELLRRAETMRTVAYIRYTVNTGDAFYEAEMNYFNRECPSMYLLDRQAQCALLDSPFAGDFEKEFGSILVTTMQNGRRFADERLVPLQVKEAELKQQYSRAAAAASCSFRGEQKNFYGLLKLMQSTDRDTRKEAFRAWADLYEQISPELDDIYSQLVALRNDMAVTLGYPHYTAMSYDQRRRFDYGPAEVEAFRNAVKAYVTPACAKVFARQAERNGIRDLQWYDEALIFPEGNAMPRGTTEELIAKAGEMYDELSPETSEFFRFMREHRLFDLETRPGKHQGGYCTSLPAFKAPFIFSNFNGTSADVDVLTHEAGHAFEGYTAGRIMPLMALVGSTSEINEIHSMSMEHFTYPWMDKFFGEETDKYLYAHLWGALNVVPYICCVDEFQQNMYTHPELDAKGRRAVWSRLEKEYMPWRSYDENPFLTEGGFWMQKQHIFLYPFYYIEYALAQTCAFQFYLRAEEDRPRAWGDYMALCRAGGSKGYFDLLKVAKLQIPLDPETVKDVTAKIEAKLAEMEAAL